MRELKEIVNTLSEKKNKMVDELGERGGDRRTGREELDCENKIIINPEDCSCSSLGHSGVA
nr:hypothetical protein [Vibrio vulnificus]